MCAQETEVLVPLLPSFEGIKLDLPVLESTIAMQEIDEIFKIFQHLGTPNEQVWPGMMRDCPDFKTDFPQWQPKPFAQVALEQWRHTFTALTETSNLHAQYQLHTKRSATLPIPWQKRSCDSHAPHSFTYMVCRNTWQLILIKLRDILKPDFVLGSLSHSCASKVWTC